MIGEGGVQAGEGVYWGTVSHQVTANHCGVGQPVWQSTLDLKKGGEERRGGVTERDTERYSHNVFIIIFS